MSLFGISTDPCGIGQHVVQHVEPSPELFSFLNAIDLQQIYIIHKTICLMMCTPNMAILLDAPHFFAMPCIHLRLTSRWNAKKCLVHLKWMQCSCHL